MMNLKRAFLATAIIWILGVSAYIGSFMLSVLDDAALQANIVLVVALIPSAIIGAKFYYGKATSGNSWTLGLVMFGITILLDATITVPAFIIPEGGSHIEFFTDPGFWFIGAIYVSVIGIYGIVRERNLKQHLSLS